MRFKTFKQWVEALATQPAVQMGANGKPLDPDKQQVKNQMGNNVAMALKAGKDPKQAAKDAAAAMLQAGKIDPKKVIEQIPDDNQQVPGQIKKMKK